MRRAVPTRKAASPAGATAGETDDVREMLEDLDRVRYFLRPWVLLLLEEQATHGYDLIKRLRTVGFEGVDRSVYRTLSALERSGAVAASWDTPDAGPARRVFAITPEGLDDLRRWADLIANLRSLLDTMVDRYRAATEPPGSRRRRRWRA